MAQRRGATSFPKKRGHVRHLRDFHVAFLRELRFLPGCGGAHPGGGAADKNIMREMRADFLAQMVCGNTKQRAKTV